MAGRVPPAIRTGFFPTAATVAAVAFLPTWAGAGEVAGEGGEEDGGWGFAPGAVRWTPVQEPCSLGFRGTLRSAGTLADGGGMARAVALLETALQRCPDHPDLLRGLARLHFRAGHLEKAEELAAHLVRIEPESADGWELLGVTLYLQDDAIGALRAWEPIRRPRIRNLEVQVLSRDGRERRHGGTDPRGTTGLREGGVLTVEGLVRGERRLGALPAATRTRLGYRALPGGLATVEGTVVLGPGNPFTRPGLAAHGFRLLGRGIRIESMDRLGHLERWELAGGMEGSLREARVALSHPAPGALGVWRWEVAHQAGRYGPAGVIPEVEAGAEKSLPADPVFRVASTHLSWRHDHWITAAFRGTAQTRVEFRGTEGTFAGGGLGWTFLTGDARGALGGEGMGWSLMGEGRREPELRGKVSRFGRLELLGSVQALEPPARGGRVASHGTPEGRRGREAASAARSPVGVGLRAGLVAVSSGVPPDPRPRIGAGGRTDLLMRARSDLDGRGVVRPRYPGTAWAHAGVEVLRPLGSLGPMEAGVALFADGVRALGGDPPSVVPDARRGEVHLGVGVRAGIPWVEGWLRVDWGIDPADGASTFSAAWVRPHPLTALRAH